MSVGKRMQVGFGGQSVNWLMVMTEIFIDCLAIALMVLIGLKAFAAVYTASTKSVAKLHS